MYNENDERDLENAFGMTEQDYEEMMMGDLDDDFDSESDFDEGDFARFQDDFDDEDFDDGLNYDNGTWDEHPEFDE